MIREAVRFGEGYLYTEEMDSAMREVPEDDIPEADVDDREIVIMPEEDSREDTREDIGEEATVEETTLEETTPKHTPVYAEWTDLYKEARIYLYGTKEIEPDAKQPMS